jgi:glycosyltransferase involved in cell wall biosynthesis
VLGLADSSYNEQQLQRAGFGSTKVVPVLMDFEALDKEADPVTDGRLDAAKAAGGADWLFVGRLAANKCQHLVVRAFAAYRRVYDPKARLWLVGGPRESRYVTALQRYIEALHLSRAVTLTGPVSDATLSSHYRHADVFVCLSEHEGFCVPLLEAMWNGVPVVALGSSAVPETVGDAGVVLPLKANRQPSAGIVAAAVHRVLDDSGLRNELTERGRLRVADFSFERTGGRFVDAFSLLEQQ